MWFLAEVDRKLPFLTDPEKDKINGKSITIFCCHLHPGLTGDQLSQKHLEIRGDLPVILGTGFSARINEEKALAPGIRAFVSKPVLKRRIAETIRKVLDDSSGNQVIESG